MSAWVLPDHLADVLPTEARHIEELRRDLLDAARSYGFELVAPPLIEHIESLLTGSGVALNLQTFKLVDQLSGRTVGVRADSTPQVARIDAHLLNRRGVTRLCYCGPVLHTRPAAPHASREPLQFGAELYGHAGLEADIEIVSLALDCLAAARLARPRIDLGHALIAKSLLASAGLSGPERADIYSALARKDAAELAQRCAPLEATLRDALRALIELYGGAEVLLEAEKRLPPTPAVRQALSDLKRMGQVLADHAVSYDLADLRGYAYYTGLRFAIYADGAPAALVRGGRYDNVGEIFGRKRAAVGLGMDLKALVAVLPARAPQPAIRAPWGDAPGLTQAIAALRARAETVVCVLPGHEHEVDEFFCDRELAQVAGLWVVQPLAA